jgi:hypothetical protein
MKANLWPLCVALLVAGAHGEEPNPSDITRKISVMGFVDVGQVVKGSFVTDDGARPALGLDGAFLNRDGIALTYSGTLKDRLHVNIGVGGLFWKPIPETSNPASTRIQFGPGISEASVQYDFQKNLNWKFGFFGYDYNPDAMNLGEYLLRSEAYPGLVRTAGSGGWVWMNDNKYKSMGTKVTWDLLDGKLRQDLVIFSEFNEVPIFDFSPSYVATFKAGQAFEFGAGFSLHRFLPVKPSTTTPGRAANRYVEIDNFPAIPAIHDTVAQRDQLGFAGGTLKDMEGFIGNYTDEAGTPLVKTGQDSRGSFFVTQAGDTLRPRKTEKLTFKAIELMARASVDFDALLGLDAQSVGPFKIFAEAAVLGVQNQPYFYENINQRIPLMLGMHIPTFGLLSLASVQMEYFKNPYPENSMQQYVNSLPQPAFPAGNPALYASNRDAGLYSEDVVKWSVYLRRNLYAGLDLFVQAANDHFRIQDVNAGPSFTPVTHTKSGWYYLFQFQWAM